MTTDTDNRAAAPTVEASDAQGDGALWEGVFLAVPVRIIGVIGHNVLGAEVQIKSYEGMPWSTARDALCGGLKMKHFTAHLACLLRDSIAREAETKRALAAVQTVLDRLLAERRGMVDSMNYRQPADSAYQELGHIASRLCNDYEAARAAVKETP